MDKTYDILLDKIIVLIECASGRTPTQTGTKLNTDLFISVAPVCSSPKKKHSDAWALIFTESDIRDGFYLKKLDKVYNSDKIFVSKKRGKAYAADVFARACIERLRKD